MVRELLPEDVQEQVTELIRQLLLVLRAMIDWAVARIERGPRGREIQVEDIPIA
jgi:DNA-binding HxlR family transcriptional regulator